MLDQAKLNAMPVETLTAIRDQVIRTINSKARAALRIGSEATFEHDGVTRRLMITKINPKTVGGYEIDAHGNHLRQKKWRVSPNLLSPVPVKAAPKIAPIGTGADRPSAAPAW